MLLVTSVLAAAESSHTELPMPTFTYGLIALLVFVVLGLVTWSYRDVANRHTRVSSGHGAAAGHSSNASETVSHAAGGSTRVG